MEFQTLSSCSVNLWSLNEKGGGVVRRSAGQVCGAGGVMPSSCPARAGIIISMGSPKGNLLLINNSGQTVSRMRKGRGGKQGFDHGI